jgi:acyl transferase domain-containing protein
MRQLLQIAALHQADGDAPQVRDADYRSPERLAQLYRQGAEIDWQRFYRGGIFRKLSLPTYPFQRRTYWLFERECGAAPLPVHPMLGKRLPLDRENNHIWESETDSDQFAYFAGHRIQGNMLMPLSGYIEMARAAVGEVLGVPVSKLANLQLHHPFLLPEKGARTVQIRVARGNRDTTFHAASRAAGAPWVLHATATVRQET